VTWPAIAMMGLFVIGDPALAGTHPDNPRYRPTAVPPHRHLAISSAQSEPTFRAELDANRMTIGDRLHLTVTVEHDASAEVMWPDSVDWGPFELLGVELLQPVQDGNRIRQIARYTLTAFELGDLEVPAFEASLRGLDGADVTTLRSEPQSVSVISVGLDQTGDIRAIKGPKDMPRNWLLLLPWALVACVAVAGASWAYRRLRARAAPGEASEIRLPARQPHEVAYDALRRLEQSGMLERGEIKEYFIEVSDIIRRYVEDRYRVDALEMASHEVIMGLERAGVVFDVRLQFERFLGDCDLVKFAKWIPETSACREMVPRARKLVDDTRQAWAESGSPGAHGDEVVLADAVGIVAASNGGDKRGMR